MVANTVRASGVSPCGKRETCAVQKAARNKEGQRDQMKLHNTTDIPNELVREIVRFTCPAGVHNYDVELRNSDNHYGGRAYIEGSSYHRNRRQFVVLRIGKPGGCCFQSGRSPDGRYYSRRLLRPQFPFLLTPYQYGQHKGRKIWIASRVEMLVYLASHELRHLWQGKAKNKAGYAWGSRGRYSEIDTEAYALNKLRAWRRCHHCHWE